MSSQEFVKYEYGEDLDFDRLNDENLKKQQGQDTYKPNQYAEVQSSSLSASEAFRQFADPVNTFEREQTSSGEGAPSESLKNKYDRIAQEIAELSADMNLIAEQDKQSQNNENSVNLLEKIDNLKGQMAKINEDKDFQSIVNNNSIDLLLNDQLLYKLKERATNANIEELINRFKSSDKKIGDEESSTIKLLIDSESQDLKEQIKLNQMESRVEYLEKLFGINKNDEVDPNTDLQHQLKRVAAQLEIYSEPHLSDKINQVSELSENMDVVAEKQKKLDISKENIENVKSLTNKFKNVKGTLQQVPQISDRIETLTELHEQSATLINKYQKIQNTQQAMIKNASENNTLIKQLDETMTENLNIFNENLEGLKQRLAKLGIN